MKNVAILIITVVLFSCTNKPLVAKPKRLLSPDEMTAILTDYYISKAYNEEVKKDKRINQTPKEAINPSAYIYKKHGIDSLTFVTNINYYLTQKEVITAIFEKTATQLDTLETQYTRQKKDKDSIQKLKNKAKQKKLKIEKSKRTERSKKG